MRDTLKSSVTGVLCVALAATAFPVDAWAGPVNVVSSDVIKASSLTDQIHYRRYYRRHYGRYYRRGYYDPSGAAFAAAAIGIIGIAAANAYRPRYYYGYPAYGYGYYPAYGYPPPYGYGYPYYGW